MGVMREDQRMSEQVTVFTLPNYMQCTMTKRALEKAGVPFDVVDLATDEQPMNRVKELGYQAAPVVVDGDRHWSGFRPDKIASSAAVRGLS
jgi:glutaredoxin-like protein NrdH